MKVLIMGASFGGMTAAYELRKRLSPGQCEIRVISKDPRFTFIPSLPWVALGSRSLDQISFDLAGSFTRKEIEFVHGGVTRIDPESRRVYTDAGEYAYDVLVIATGHRSANEAVPGLGPFDGPGHSLMSPPEAEEARDALQTFLGDPGPLVVGCAPGASCIGPAYEFVFQVDHLLRSRRMRHKVPIVFVTPEPFLGHFGVGGVGKARQFLEGEFEQRDIRYFTSAAVSRIAESAVDLADGTNFESAFSLFIPPLAGVKPLAEAPNLANPKGFVPVEENYRHQTFSDIYAVGVAVALPPVEQTPVPVNFPKTGHMTEQMARMAAHNIAARVLGNEKIARPLHAECILDMGDRAVMIKADPFRPPRNIARFSEGRHWLWAKKAFERYYLWRSRRGKTVAGEWGW
ncbi:NAD(P)/FAD-dependent oxidoreductase [Sedimenticola selenatireducens]|uniref:NAD(P)/FAD-dependent oxidoreductase n=1 Tax=Sedimenticola selenatireducens TaxID=191960 RepID=UPI00055F9BC2|nr:FAD-dependent oxidoreductase [Sedimenticola selenatireducens]